MDRDPPGGRRSAQVVTFDPRPICRALNAAHVRYVVIGGFASVIHGSPLPTADIDIVPGRDPDNLDRLGAALRGLNAKLRTAAGPVEAPIDGPFLAAIPFMLNLTTDFGDIDLTFEPAGPRTDHEAWNRDAIDVPIADDLIVRVASLRAVIDSKRAAGRPKDQAALPYLESLLDQLEE